MEKELPEEPLKPAQFARHMGISINRLIRVANSMRPPLELVNGEIPSNKYSELYELILNEPKTLDVVNAPSVEDQNPGKG